jgi:N-acetylneuraminic acid mutarotase
LGTNEEYDPATDTWTAKASMPTPKYSFAAAVVKDKIYAISGAAKGVDSDTPICEEYDPMSDKWNGVAPVPTKRDGISAVTVADKIYAIGGSNTSTGPYYQGTNEQYDPQRNSWTSWTMMPTGRESLGAAVVNNKIYAIGGHNDSGASNANEELDLGIFYIHKKN